jgi:uncharacterized protein (TIGR04222 family)
MHPWGLSGPDFLWLYIAGLVVGVAVAVGARMRVRRPRLAEPPATLDATELGFLGGGAANAVQVAVVRLFESEAVRANRSGQLSAASSAKPTGQPLDDAVLGELAKPRMVNVLTGRTAVRNVTTAMGESLVRRGLLVPPAKAIRARWLGQVVLYVVFAIGIVRWINGMDNGLPVGYLTFLLAVTAILLVCLNVRAVSVPKARTVHGDRAVAAVRARGSVADPAERVAVSGPRAHPDAGLSFALSRSTPGLVPPAWGYASAGSFNTYVPTAAAAGSAGGGGYTCSSGSSGSSCSGGSSCGGGGGGGCGGGSS